MSQLLSFIELMDVYSIDCQMAISINNNDFEKSTVCAEFAGNNWNMVMIRSHGGEKIP